MKFYSRKLIKPQDLNGHGTLFGGTLLAWIDEEAVIYGYCQLGTTSLVTKYMSEIDFIGSAAQGDVVEIGMQTTGIGRSSITLRCEVRNKFTKETLIRIDRLVFVHVDAAGRPRPHGVAAGRDAVQPEPQTA